MELRIRPSAGRCQSWRRRTIAAEAWSLVTSSLGHIALEYYPNNLKTTRGVKFLQKHMIYETLGIDIEVNVKVNKWVRLNSY